MTNLILYDYRLKVVVGEQRSEEIGFYEVFYYIFPKKKEFSSIINYITLTAHYPVLTDIFVD